MCARIMSLNVQVNLHKFRLLLSVSLEIAAKTDVVGCTIGAITAFVAECQEFWLVCVEVECLT